MEIEKQFDENLEEDDFQKLLEDKRHKEIISLLQDTNNNDFQKLLESKRHKEVILVLKEILLSLSKDSPQITFDVSGIIQEIVNIKNELPSAIINLGKLIETKLNSLQPTGEKDNYNWEFIVHRDSRGLIYTIDANKVTIKNIK
jgi:hypothetical protein